MIIDQAKEVLKIEAEGILALVDRLDHRFEEMVDVICAASGRLIVSGIGKSGIVGRKIVATLNSTGTRALFLHPVEAMHGDLGMVDAGDVFMALSNSGETDELNILVPSIKAVGCTIIAMTGAPASTLATLSDIVIDVGVCREACPLGLAPTASTTALLAMGDALAVVLINKKEFKSDDFRRFHPGGALGQHLSSQIHQLMLPAAAVPCIGSTATITDAVAEIDRLELGAVIIVEDDGRLVGILTDGDIRRSIARRIAPLDAPVTAIMSANPKAVTPDAPAYDALNLMERFQITVLPVVDAQGRIAGMLHLHDILGKGEFSFNGR